MLRREGIRMKICDVSDQYDAQDFPFHVAVTDGKMTLLLTLDEAKDIQHQLEYAINTIESRRE